MVEQKAWLAGDEPYPKSFTLRSHRATQAGSLAPSTYNVITLIIINLVLLPPITQKRKKTTIWYWPHLFCVSWSVLITADILFCFLDSALLRVSKQYGNIVLMFTELTSK